MLSPEGEDSVREQMSTCLLLHLQQLPAMSAVALVALCLHGQEQAALGFLLTQAEELFPRPTALK